MGRRVALRQKADDDYAARMYEWMQGDQADAKPIPKKQALDDAISESAAESAAIDLLRMEVLDRKGRACGTPPPVAGARC